MPWYENIDSRLGEGAYGTGKVNTGTPSRAGNEVTSAVVDVVSGLANLLGLSPIVEKFAKKASGVPDYNDVQTAVNQIVSAAKARGEDTLSSITNQLASVGLMTKSQIQKSASAKAGKSLKARQTAVRNSLAKGDYALSKAQSSIAKLSAATAGDYASGQAYADAKSALHDAAEAAKYYSSPVESGLDGTERGK